VRDSPQLRILQRSVILGCFSPQDDTSLKCWGCYDHDARPVHLIIMMIQWIRTSRLSIKNSLSRRRTTRPSSAGAATTPHPESHSLPNPSCRHRLGCSSPVNDWPHPSILCRSLTLGCFSPQDDTSLKCWGSNDHGGLGGDVDLGDDANGPCPPIVLGR